MQFSFAALGLALAATVSALPATEPALAARQQSCVDYDRTFDRFFVERIDRDNENQTCQRFQDLCYDLQRNGVRGIEGYCEVSERNIIRSSCVGQFQGQLNSYTRNVAKQQRLGLSVDQRDGCPRIRGTNKCSQTDFDGRVRAVCRR